MPIQSQKGFTLLEIIVVLTMVGIIVGGILLNTSLIDSDKDLKKTGEQLSKLIRHVHQQAFLEHANYALSKTDQGYIFIQYDGENWLLTQQKLLKEKSLNEQLESDLLIENKSVTPLKIKELRSEFNLKSKANNENQNATVKLTPHILILASGEMTPFEWLFENQITSSRLTISGSFNGTITTEYEAETL